MSVLVSDIINEAFLNIGAIAPGETITSAESADAFLRLNQLLASWSLEQLTAPSLTHTSFTLTAGQPIYTLGTAGTLVTSAEPLRVTGAQSLSGNFRSSIKVMSWDQFAAEVSDDIATTSVLAKVLAADGSFPNINLKVFPIPAASPGSLLLDYWMAIAQFSTVGDTVTLPSGWQRALHYNLAVDIYPQYGRAGGIDPVLAAKAQESKGQLNALNAQILGMQQAPPAGGQ